MEGGFGRKSRRPTARLRILCGFMYPVRALLVLRQILSRLIFYSHWLATNPVGPADADENKARVLIEKRTAINLLEAFAVATKHYLRGEDGIYYTDLYHLVKFLPPYANPLTRNVPATVASPLPDLNYSQSGPSSLPAYASHISKRPSAIASSITTVPAPETRTPTPKRKEFYLRSQSTLAELSFTADKSRYYSGVNEEGFLRPARIPPKFSFMDWFPFSLVSRFLKDEQKQVKGMRYAAMVAKKEDSGSQNIPLEISLYLVSAIPRGLSLADFFRPS